MWISFLLTACSGSTPSPWSVEYVESTVASGDLAGLVNLMSDVMGLCDNTSTPAPSPWNTNDASSCETLAQRESDVLAR